MTADLEAPVDPTDADARKAVHNLRAIAEILEWFTGKGRSDDGVVPADSVCFLGEQVSVATETISNWAEKKHRFCW